MSFIPLGVLLALAIAALMGVGLRLAALTGAVGLERTVAAAVLAGGAAVAEALGLGLVGLGSSPVALSLAAGLTWLACLRLPVPQRRVRDDLVRWWRGIGHRWQVVAAFVAVGAGYVVAWILSHPNVSFDSGLYHYPEVVAWVQSGHPGSVVRLSYDFPFGDYPVTDEVLMTWGAGIARSWIPIAVWPIAAYALLVNAGVVGLRNLRVPRAALALAVLAVALLPWAVRQLSETGNDLPALAWAAATVALCAGAPRRPGLLPIALLGAGLAVGTKTTPVVFIVVALALALWACRGDLRRLRWWLVLGAAGAVGVGGVWYLRNLIDHGSPLWPFLRLPGADPIPRIIGLANEPFLGRISATVHSTASDYATRLAGGLLALAAVPFAMALVRRRAVLLAGATTIVGFLAWARTPGTGLPRSKVLFIPEGYPFSESRYALPVLACAALTIALAARDGGRRTRIAALVVLAGAVLWSAIVIVTLPGQILPPAGRVLVVAVLGTVILVGLTGLVPDVRAFLQRSPRLRTALGGTVGAVLLVVILGAVLAPSGKGWTGRTANASTSQIIGLPTLGWAAYDAALRPHDRISFAGWALVGPLAGDRFQRRFSLLSSDATCVQVRTAAQQGWLVTTEPDYGHGFFGLTPFSANACMTGVKPRFAQKMRVYGPPVR